MCSSDLFTHLPEIPGAFMPTRERNLYVPEAALEVAAETTPETPAVATE